MSRQPSFGEGEGEQNALTLTGDYEEAFSFVERAKQLECSGDLVSAKAHYMQGVEIFFRIIKLEQNASKRNLVRQNLSTFIEKSEAIATRIESQSIPSNVPFTNNTTMPMYPQQPMPQQPMGGYPYNNAHQSQQSFSNPMYPQPMPMYPPNQSQPYPQPYPQPQNHFPMGSMGGHPNMGSMTGIPIPTGIPNNLEPSAPSADDILLDLPDPPGFGGNKSGDSGIGLPDPPSKLPGQGGGGGRVPIPHDSDDDDKPPARAAQDILDLALEHDTNKEYGDAERLYVEASELFMEALKQPGAVSNAEKTKIRSKVATIIGRVEVLRKQAHKNQTAAASRVNAGVSGESLSQRELEVLRKSSYIRTVVLYPWMPEDSSATVKFDSPWKDSAGMLPLSEKQKSKLGKWRRVANLSHKPQALVKVSPYCITQTLITDCSFVSSLTVTALYEQSFGKQLITSTLYPQNAKGRPMYNASGKYLVKLFLNGCYRKVEVDDYLPVSTDGQLLCSFSNNKDEFWVSILEKAFLKVMGGYDFPGSTSSEDLHVLTGWIPERVGFHDSNSKELDIERMFDRLVSGQKFGDCLITIATRDIPEEEADSVGLVPTHAYAVLRVEKLGGHKFLLIKNPWARKRWKGRFSVEDATSWTPQLRKALNYNPEKQRQKDDGIFWMQLEDVMKYFTAVYMNWNPELFPWRVTQHGFWDKKIGPKNDSYNMGYNPQFLLDVELPKNGDKSSQQQKSKSESIAASGGSVWILLSKHMENTKREDQSKDDFLTLHIYDDSAPINTIDRRIFYRNGSKHTGVYINSPHYLMRLDIDPKTNATRGKDKHKFSYTVVVSQYEKKNDVAFSITAYSTLPCRFRPVSDGKYWKYRKCVTGMWNKHVSGGCPNYPTFPNNPQFRIKVGYKSNLRFLLEAPIDYSVGISLYLCTNLPSDDDTIAAAATAPTDNTNKPTGDDSNADESKTGDGDNESKANVEETTENISVNNSDNSKAKVGKIVSSADYSKELLIRSSDTYRPGVAMMDCGGVPEGTYIAIISTFKPGQMGGFKFTMRSNENVGFTPV